MNSRTISLFSLLLAVAIANSLHALPAKPAKGAAARRPVARAQTQRLTPRAVATVAKPAPKAVVASPAARRPAAPAPVAARAVADEFQSLSSPGLFNGGNNCFINTALQCTFASPALFAYLNDLFTDQAYTAGIAGSPVARTLQPVFAAYCSGDYGLSGKAIPTAIISPFHTALRNLFTNHDDAKIRSGADQGDAGEALAKLCSALNEIKRFSDESPVNPISLNVETTSTTIQWLVQSLDQDNCITMIDKNYLIFNLDRVAAGETAMGKHRSVKRATLVSAEAEITIVTPEDLKETGMPMITQYRLVACGYHGGTATSGHWTAMRFNEISNKWETRSDATGSDSISPVGKASANLSLAVYERILDPEDAAAVAAVVMPYDGTAGAHAAAGGAGAGVGYGHIGGHAAGGAGGAMPLQHPAALNPVKYDEDDLKLMKEFEGHPNAVDQPMPVVAIPEPVAAAAAAAGGAGAEAVAEALGQQQALLKNLETLKAKLSQMTINYSISTARIVPIWKINTAKKVLNIATMHQDKVKSFINAYIAAEKSGADVSAFTAAMNDYRNNILPENNRKIIEIQQFIAAKDAVAALGAPLAAHAVAAAGGAGAEPGAEPVAEATPIAIAVAPADHVVTDAKQPVPVVIVEPVTAPAAGGAGAEPAVTGMSEEGKDSLLTKIQTMSTGAMATTALALYDQTTPIKDLNAGNPAGLLRITCLKDKCQKQFNTYLELIKQAIAAGIDLSKYQDTIRLVQEAQADIAKTFFS